jgi:cold shock protein
VTSTGRVRVWHEDDGWGVVDSDDTPGGCWVHVSAVLVAGEGLLHAGQEVRLVAERARQDGFAFRAVEVWPADREPDRSAVVEVDGPSSGLSSSLTLTFDRPDEPPAERRAER